MALDRVSRLTIKGKNAKIISTRLQRVLSLIISLNHIISDEIPVARIRKMISATSSPNLIAKRKLEIQKKKNWYSIDTYVSIILFLFYIIYKIYLNYLIHVSSIPRFLRLTKYIWSSSRTISRLNFPLRTELKLEKSL